MRNIKRKVLEQSDYVFCFHFRWKNAIDDDIINMQCTATLCTIFWILNFKMVKLLLLCNYLSIYPAIYPVKLIGKFIFILHKMWATENGKINKNSKFVSPQQNQLISFEKINYLLSWPLECQNTIWTGNVLCKCCAIDSHSHRKNYVNWCFCVSYFDC